jgi:hypothetical protein
MRSRYRELGLELVSLEENAIAHPSDLPWNKKRGMMGQEILSNCFSRNPSRDRGTK